MYLKEKGEHTRTGRWLTALTHYTGYISYTRQVCISHISLLSPTSPRSIQHSDLALFQGNTSVSRTSLYYKDHTVLLKGQMGEMCAQLRHRMLIFHMDNYTLNHLELNSNSNIQPTYYTSKCPNSHHFSVPRCTDSIMQKHIISDCEALNFSAVGWYKMSFRSPYKLLFLHFYYVAITSQITSETLIFSVTVNQGGYRCIVHPGYSN